MQKLLSLLTFSNWKDADKRRIAEGTFYSFIIQGFSVAMVFAGNLLLARFAGADVYGVYVHVFNWISILSVASTAGRDDLVLAEMTRYQAANEPGLIPLLVRRTNKHVLIASAIVTAVFLLLIFLFRIPTLTEYRYAFLLGAIGIYCSAFIILNQYILQSLDHIRLSQLVDKLVKPGLMIVGLLLAKSLGLQMDDRFFILLVVMILIVCCVILGGFVLNKTAPFGQSAGRITGSIDNNIANNDVFNRARHTRKTTSFFLITLLTFLATKIIMLILPRFESVNSIGVFNICMRFSDLILYPYFLMHSVLPQMFARHTGSDGALKQSLYASATRMMTLLSLPLLAIICMVGKYLLGWFGPDFTTGYTALILLGVSQFFYAFFGPANTILMMQDNEKYAVRALLIYTGLLTGLSFWLIRSYGITGGALSMAIGCLVYNIIVSVYAYKVSGVITPWLRFLAHAEKNGPAGPAEKNQAGKDRAPAAR